VVIHLEAMFAELQANVLKGLKGWENRLLVSDRAHIVFDFHLAIDGLQEVEKSASKRSIGTTKRGIGPTYSSKATRNGLRLTDLLTDFDDFSERFRAMVAAYQIAYKGLEVDVDAELTKYKGLAERIRPFVTDTIYFLHTVLADSTKRVLVEGANAQMLDVDFGTYPYVTSSSCSVGGACTGLGLPPSRLNRVFGVVKAYTTRVGDGAFATEQLNEVGEALQSVGFEFGVTTGRKRRCGWLDMVQLKYAHMVNSISSIMITKLDVLDDFEEVKIGVNYTYKGEPLKNFPSSMLVLKEVEVEYLTMPGWKSNITQCREFDQLPQNAQLYVRKIEELLGVPVQWVGVGPKRDATIRLF
jgi:adenylosuccinate synthase